MKSLKITLAIFTAIIAIPILFILYMWVVEWRPSEIENVKYNKNIESIIAKDTLKILSWNIGYGGLGDNMDYFYDGGVKSRDTKERTEENINNIIKTLKKYDDVDFILLQEVDSISKRDYYMDLYSMIVNNLPTYNHYFGCNYQSDFVPIPLCDPIGKVKGGVMTLTKYTPIEALRYDYNTRFAFPVRLFNLKRCLLSLSFKMENGSILYIGNTHNNAFDDGDMKDKEIDFIDNYISDKPYSVIAGDWNSNPPRYKASYDELNNDYFTPLTIEQSRFENRYVISYDSTKKTARYNNKPYKEGSSIETILDFAMSQKGIKPINIETIDLKYKWSDHNPILFTFIIDN